MQVKEIGRINRHQRIRKKISGTAERPRVAVHRSSGHLYVQAIDDLAQKTLAGSSSRGKGFKADNSVKGKIVAAEQLGKIFAELLKQKGIQKIAFDRGGYLYHGRVKALAEALRKNGIQF